MDAALKSYVAFYETLTPETLDRLDSVVAADVVFQDPFNDIQGRDAVRRLFDDMFARLDAPTFEILGSAVLSHGQRRGVIHWRFSAGMPSRSWRLDFEGTTIVTFDIDGLCVSHVDFWDPSVPVYEKVPVLGWCVRRVRSLLSAD